MGLIARYCLARRSKIRVVLSVANTDRLQCLNVFSQFTIFLLDAVKPFCFFPLCGRK